MRADMGKVLVERPRLKSWIAPGPHKGYRKAVRKLLDAGDAPPQREGMKRPYINRKCFNEHLGPLRRFLNSNVGRPWDKIYAEICEHVDRGNVVQKHILTHLFDYVVTTVILIEGRPCDGSPGYRYGHPLHESERRDQWYVCPKSGLLRRTRHVPRDDWRRRPAPPRRVVLTKSRMCLELNGQWELVTVAPLPVPEYRGSRYDVVRKRAVYSSSAAEARELYGADVYATDRRPLSKRELRSLPVPIDWVG
ncbi:MAG: hypothetical protein JWO38_3138 [Gemmataceae bacterium]|nr:hypothetical protein [Gemmataceae bacterium]